MQSGHCLDKNINNYRLKKEKRKRKNTIERARKERENIFPVADDGRSTTFHLAAFMFVLVKR
jgi:hypothetical protein